MGRYTPAGKPESDRQTAAFRLFRFEVDGTLHIEIVFGQPFGHRLVREAEAHMGVLVPQVFMIVRREIHNGKPPPGFSMRLASASANSGCGRKCST